MRTNMNMAGEGAAELRAFGKSLSVEQRAALRDAHGLRDLGGPPGCPAHAEGLDCCVDVILGET